MREGGREGGEGDRGEGVGPEVGMEGGRGWEGGGREGHREEREVWR